MSTQTKLKEIYKELRDMGGSPLKQKKSILEFVNSDKKKINFLKNIKEFNKKYPKFDYADLLPIIDKEKQYRLNGVVEFIKNPTSNKGLVILLQDEEEEEKNKVLPKYNPQLFEMFKTDIQLKEIIYNKEKTGSIETEDIKEVVSPKIRGSAKAKEMKEAEEAKARDPERFEDVTERVAKAQEIERQQKEKEAKLSKKKVDSVGNTYESEDDPRVVERETDKFLDELIKETVDKPATMSPDERDKLLDESMKEFEAEELDIEEIDISTNQKPPPPTATQAQTQTQQAPAQTQTQTQAQQPQAQAPTQTSDTESPTGKVEEKEIKDIPQEFLAIPKERASAKGKSEEQLINDIEYFFKTYPESLDKEKLQFNKIQRGKSPALRKKQLIELHRRIVAKIGNIEDDRENKRIGIILNANKYLDDKINAILLQKLTEGLTPENLVVDVSGKAEQDKSKRVGSYQITKGRSGLLNAQKAPIYRSIPTTNDSQIRKSKRPIKLKTLPNQRWDEVNTAKKQVRLDPFIDTNQRPNRFNIYL